MNCLVGQSGGPTAVINSSLAGVIKSAFDNNFDKVYATLHGIEGILNESLVEIDREKFIDTDASNRLQARPSSILGSCRYRLSDDMKNDFYKKVFQTLRKYEITHFIYIGGNDSMDTVKKLNLYMRENQIDDIKICGCPKTIDNDLFMMDHSPGYGSALKFIVNTLRDIRTDVDIYNKKTVTFVEIMGRNTGWLTAGTLVSNYNMPKKIVNLVYLSENPLPKEKILEDIKNAHQLEDNLIVAVSEGFMDTEEFFKEEVVRSYDEGFNHPIIAGITRKLSEFVYRELGIKTKAVEFSIVQRTSNFISKTDTTEAFLLGKKALEYSLDKTNVVAVVNRVSDSPYDIEFACVESDKIANLEKFLPKEWLENLEENILKYALPLINGEVNQEFENGMIKYIELEEIIK